MTRWTMTLEERFWSKVDKSGECWVWIAAKTPRGYGLINVDGRSRLAHQIAWGLTRGDRGSLYVLHHCDNPPCVNPDHLFLGTHQDNMRDMAAKGRRLGRVITQETREKIRNTLRGKSINAEQRKRLSEAMTGRVFSDEHRKNISAAKMGSRHSPETLAKLRAAKLGKKRGPMPEEHKRKISAAKIGGTVSQETRDKIAATLRRRHTMSSAMTPTEHHS